ncbi:hypothetical protein [Natrinema gelatinilyticum]|uniref:hypothetical protein n=1 Tax=Natrinema gelatinilyticum TaxID=2961571 RepID=UPI0020C4FC43|nr:hypothetical protein [Natrinema gelatinilyticum]
MKATAEIMTMDGVRCKQTQYVCVLDGRALTHYLTVLEDQDRVRGCRNLYLVVSESGREYLDEM